jgi:hypothetical protein
MTRFLLLALLAGAIFFALRPDGERGPPAPATETTLASLIADPAEWDGVRVSLTGKVIDRVTLLGIGGILVADDAGNRIIAAGWTGAVTPGAEERIEGTFRLALSVGDLEVPVVFMKE